MTTAKKTTENVSKPEDYHQLLDAADAADAIKVDNVDNVDFDDLLARIYEDRILKGE